MNRQSHPVLARQKNVGFATEKVGESAITRLWQPCEVCHGFGFEPTELGRAVWTLRLGLLKPPVDFLKGGNSQRLTIESASVDANTIKWN